MKVKVNNLYRNIVNGDFCCLLSSVRMQNPKTEAWCDGVVFINDQGLTLCRALGDWEHEYALVAEYDGDDENVLMMIRRANPGRSDFDFVRVFESWHESEIGITGHMLELAVTAVAEQYVWPRNNPEEGADLDSIEVAISTEDLQHVLQNYEVERDPVPHGFKFRITKIRK